MKGCFGHNEVFTPPCVGCLTKAWPALETRLADAMARAEKAEDTVANRDTFIEMLKQANTNDYLERRNELGESRAEAAVMLEALEKISRVTLNDDWGETTRWCRRIGSAALASTPQAAEYAKAWVGMERELAARGIHETVGIASGRPICKDGCKVCIALDRFRKSWRIK